MSVTLSCLATRGKGCFIVNKEGYRVKEDVFYIRTKDKDSSHLKSFIFETILRGVRSVKDIVDHDDILIIRVQNENMVKWLNSEEVYKGYEDLMNAIFDAVDLLDCRYRYTFSKVIGDCKSLLSEEPKQEVLTGVSSIFDNLEG